MWGLAGRASHRSPLVAATVAATACVALACGTASGFSLPALGGRGPSGGWRGGWQGPAPGAQGGLPAAAAPRPRPAGLAGAPACSAGILLAGVAAALQRRRAQAPRTRRRVTLEDIANVTISDVPVGWRKKISLGMARRDAVVQAIRRKLDDTFFVMAWNKEGMETPELEAARSMFPDSVMVRGLKNSLVRKAMEGTPWEDFGKVLRGSNMYCFVMADTDLKATIQAYIKLERQFNRVEKVAEVFEKVSKKYTFQLQPLVGGIMRDEWNVIAPEDIPKFKDFPTKTELIAKIAGSIKQVPQKLAVCSKQLPQKIAIGTKKIVEKMEEEGKATVADVVA